MNKQKLSKEERSRIATEAAKKRREREAQKIEEQPIANVVPQEEVVADLATTERHCPACMNGQSLEEGEGTHALPSLEHPLVLPAAFRDAAEDTVVVPTAPIPPQKPAKKQSRPMPKEFKSASSYAEKRLPVAIREKSEAVAQVARLDAEINELLRVIQVLSPSQPAAQPVPYNPLAAQYPQQVPYMPSAPITPIVPPAQVQPMRAGGAGIADVPAAWMND